MTETLSVDLNRQSVHSIETSDRFEVSDDFTVELTNHGEAAHVHITLDADLSKAIAFDGGNHFIEAGRTRTIEAIVDQRSRPISGRLKIVTGYGAETAYVEISLIPPERRVEKSPVEVDDRLSKPRPREGPPSGGSDLSLTSRSKTIAAVSIVLISLVLVVVGALIAGTPAVIIGVGIVLVGIAGAVLLLRDQS